MKEITYRIPDESTALISELVEKLGGADVSKKRAVKRKTKNKQIKKKEVTPTFLFGKWKDYDIDPVKLREELWKREF